MPDIDPLSGNTEELQASLLQPAAASMSGEVAFVEVDADGSLLAIRLTDYGRRLHPDTLVDAIVRLHATALTEARKSVADAVVRLENDPRLLSKREEMIDALNQPLPQGQTSSAAPNWPSPAPSSQLSQQDSPPQRSQPTQEEEEEMDRYYQRQSWLEY